MKNQENEQEDVSRRRFLGNTVRGAAALAVGGVSASVASRVTADDTVWQLDPDKCVQCGNCATNCVLNPSAVKCVHAYDVCGYCDLCGGYFHPDAPELDTGAENQLCPVGAIKRTYVEDPFYQYTIDESLCIGCGKCVKGCAAFGNGSLFLQVRHDRCLNCNECSIARACPADAFRRVPAGSPYLLKGRSGKERDR
jgi:electron transport complex protein RnfB